jgi:hypothetical protein
MGQLCSRRLRGGNLRQVEGNEGIEETLIWIEERKSAINPTNHGVDVERK